MTDFLIPFSALAYVGVWIIFMASRARRSLRSVLFLIATSLPLLIASSAELVEYTVTAATVAALWGLGLWDLGEALAPMRLAEARFDRSLWSICERVLKHRRKLNLDDWDVERAEHTAILRRTLMQIGSMKAPSDDWVEILRLISLALEFDLSVFEAERSMNSATATASLARWEAIHR